MRREQRLAKAKQFEAVYTTGRPWSNDLVVLKALPNELGISRYGFAVGKRLGKAVVRNRVKRRLREGARSIRVKDGWDMIFVARQQVVAVDYPTLKRAMEEVLSQALLVVDEASGRNEG